MISRGSLGESKASHGIAVSASDSFVMYTWGIVHAFAQGGAGVSDALPSVLGGCCVGPVRSPGGEGGGRRRGKGRQAPQELARNWLEPHIISNAIHS